MPADSRYPRFSLAELLVFVKALDDSLAAPAHVLVIGGAAAALGYGVDVATNDIDLFQGDMERVLGVAARARAVTGLAVNVERATVADIPCDSDERIVRVLPQLVRLRIDVLDRHDLVLSKTVRASGHDHEQIDELHARHPLDLDVLVERSSAR